MKKVFNNDDELLRKGVFPYEFMDSFDKLNYPSFPSIDAFYSCLSNNGMCVYILGYVY